MFGKLRSFLRLRLYHHVCYRYVDRVTDLLRQRLKQAELLEKKREAWLERGKAAQEERESLEPKLSLLQERSRELQKQVSGGN